MPSGNYWAAALALALLLPVKSAPAAFDGPLNYDPIYTRFTVSTAELDQTNTATLAVITGLSQTLAAGKTYVCHGHIAIASGSATAGAKVGLVATSGLTATSISRTIRAYSNTALSVNSTTAALDVTSGGAGAAALITEAIIDAAIVVNTGGTINAEGAQDVAASGATTKFLVNSYFFCVRLN